MSLVRWHNFNELERLQNRLNRLFEEFPLPYLREGEDWIATPAVEITQNEEEVTLKLEVPGIKPEDLNIEVTKDNITISGERKQETKEEGNGITRTEFRYGKFQRTIPLPVQIDNTNTKAQYKDGILCLTCPKVEEEKHKVVKVKVG